MNPIDQKGINESSRTLEDLMKLLSTQIDQDNYLHQMAHLSKMVLCLKDLYDRGVTEGKKDSKISNN